MKSLILAAGYATRLYPLTKTFPKPLLKVGGITILDRLIADLDKIPSITGHIVVTNKKFSPFFELWKYTSNYSKDIIIINDGSTDNNNRLGAVIGMQYAISKLNIDEDLLVLAGDNVVDFSFSQFVSYAQEKKRSCITFHEEPSLSALQKTGVLEATPDLRVIAMHEKPQMPPSNMAVPPFYYYTAEDLKLLDQAIGEGCGYDAPGNFVKWLCTRSEMFAWSLHGKRYDIGDLDSYKKVDELFSINEK